MRVCQKLQRGVITSGRPITEYYLRSNRSVLRVEPQIYIFINP